MPLAKVELTDRWTVNPVTLAVFAVQLRLTVRCPPALAPLTAVRAAGRAGRIGTDAAATLLYADWTIALIAVTRYEYVVAVAPAAMVVSVRVTVALPPVRGGRFVP